MTILGAYACKVELSRMEPVMSSQCTITGGGKLGMRAVIISDAPGVTGGNRTGIAFSGKFCFAQSLVCVSAVQLGSGMRACAPGLE